MILNGRTLRNIAAILHNIDKDELEKAGIITPGAVGGSDWERFNRDVGTFILKLPDDRREALAEMISHRLRLANVARNG